MRGWWEYISNIECLEQCLAIIGIQYMFIEWINGEWMNEQINK